MKKLLGVALLGMFAIGCSGGSKEKPPETTPAQTDPAATTPATTDPAATTPPPGAPPAQ